MSSVPTLVTAELFNYLATRTTPETPFLAQLKSAALAIGIPDIWISTDQAVFMQILLRLIRAEKVIEVGTLAGYSALTMAQALPAGGMVDTLEIDAGHVAFAREWIAKSEVADRVTVHHGDAMALLPGLADGTYDAAFIDADKGNYAHYLQHCQRLVRPGGLILVDNAFAFGQVLAEHTATDDVWAIRAFNDLMARQPGLQSIIVPTGDGLWVGVKDAAD